MNRIEKITKILEARLHAYDLDLRYKEHEYGEDSWQASKARGIWCECYNTLGLLKGTEHDLDKSYKIWYE